MILQRAALNFKNLIIIHNDKPPQDVWNCFYNQNDEIPDCDKETNCSISQEDEKIFVFECSFISLTNSAIRISENTPKFLHSFCFFDRCKINDKSGGVIFFNCKSSIVQDRFCSINASITGGPWFNGIHSHTYLTENSNINLNIIAESSVSLCSETNNFYTIDMLYGICGIFSSIISNNIVYASSGFRIFQPNGCCVINFSTFEKNDAYSDCLSHKYGRYHDFFCNIVKNSQRSDESSCIFSNAIEHIVENCTILT